MAPDIWLSLAGVELPRPGGGMHSSQLELENMPWLTGEQVELRRFDSMQMSVRVSVRAMWSVPVRLSTPVGIGLVGE